MTKALLTGLLGGFVALLALGQPARADQEKPVIAAQKADPNTYVVLVGVSQYSDKQIKPRPNAEADVKALHKLFTDKEYLGVAGDHIRLLTGKGEKDEKATRANFLKTLKWLSQSAGPKDKVIFAYIGQGGPVGESGDRRCYFLVDSTFKGRDKDAVTTEEVEEAFKKIKAHHVAVFLDVDFKGFVDDGKSRAIAEPTLGKAPYKEFLGDDGSEDHMPLPGRVAFLATNGLSTSLDLKDHGLFTEVILEGLKGKADNEGYEADGLVTVDELARYMNKRLPELARKNGKSEKEKDQDHFVIAGAGAHFELTHNPAASGVAKKRLDKLADLIKSKEIPEKYREEATTLLERMPVLKKRQELRKAYQGLVDGKLKLADFEEKRSGILESMEMKRTEALVFARKVLEATDVIKEDYVRDVNQGQMVVWAVRELYNYVEEKVPEQIENKLKNAKTMREVQLLALLAEARQALGKREDLDNQKDLNVTLQRMLHRLDPHTTYIDPETKQKFDQDIAGNFKGIGIQIRKDLHTDQLLVVTPIIGSPAYKAKIMAGDLITHIIREVDSDGNPLNPPQVTPTKGLSINKAVKLITGQADTKVKLTIQREGKEKPFDVELTRAQIEVESVLGAKRKDDDNWDYMIDHKNKIGYIRLSSFARNSYRDMEKVMKDLVRQGVKGFVLDLRFNPGGLLDIAIKITDLYIDDGLIVSIRPRGGSAREARFNGRHEGSLLDFPMVCLVNGYSASGSEIVSAALQDHRRAIIIGERSYGKGSVQNIRDFEVTDPKTGEPKKAEIKLTTASFWRPSGKNLNKASTAGKDEDEWGVTPDKVIKLAPRERRDLAEHQRNLETIERADRRAKQQSKEFKDRQLDAALEYLRGQIKMASRGSSRKAG
jgi:carboxyl-terminal processing protease